MIRMIRVVALAAMCAALSSCATIKDLQDSESFKGLGSFELNPVQENSYWYDGRSYEYNDYAIQVTSEPVPAKIKWNGRLIGTTPFTYRYSGILDRDDRVVVRAVPLDENIPAQEAVLRVRTELPRNINFDLRKKQQ